MNIIIQYVQIKLSLTVYTQGLHSWSLFSIPGFGIGKFIIQGSRRDYTQVVIISRIMIVTIYIGCYNKLAFHSLASPWLLYVSHLVVIYCIRMVLVADIFVVFRKRNSSKTNYKKMRCI